MSQNIVNLLGAGSGIDTQALVNQLVEVERAAPQQRIDDKRERLQTQISDYGLLNSALSTLQDAADALGNPDTYDTPNYTLPNNSDALIVTDVNSGTPIGDYSFTVSQLAQAQSLSSSAVFTTATEAIGTGSLTFAFGSWNAGLTDFTEDSTSSSQTVTIDSSNNSLNGLAETINDADFGVQASVINDGSGYRLVLRAESGESNQLQITVADADSNNTDANGLSRFAFNETVRQMSQSQAGQDANLTINGLAITRESNILDDVVPGLETILSETTEVGESVNISIVENTQTAEQTIRDFVEAYNLFLETIEPLVGFNEETDDYGSLANDTLAKNMPSRIRQLLVGDVDGLNSTFTALTNIGIRTELDGTLSINETDFTRALDENYSQFKRLFSSITESSSDQIVINSFGDNTATGTYDVVVTQAPTKGNLEGTDITDSILADLDDSVPTSATLTGIAPTASLSDFYSDAGVVDWGAASLPLDLSTQGASVGDYDFSMTVNGVSSAANIRLPIQDYSSYDDMASALQTAINSDANFSGVVVSYDTDHFELHFPIPSTSFSASFTSIGSSSNDLGTNSITTSTSTGNSTDFDFTIEVDGTTSGTISLARNNYSTFADLASHIQTQINADATLSGAGAAVTVAHNGTQLVVTSNSTGVSSTINTATASGSLASSLGLTSGSVVQGAASGGNTTLYDFTIDLDGVTSGTISLDTAVYADNDALAAHIQTQINADATLSAAGAAVDVTYDSGADTFTIESRRYGASSSVSVTNVGANASDLGLAGGISTNGVNVAGTVDGVAGFGSGNVLLPALGQPGESLAMVITENVTTNVSNTLNFSRGFGGALELLISQFLESNGVISLREESLNEDIDDLDTDQARLDRRIDGYQERITAQFIAMEAIVRSLQDSSSFLESTLSNLLNSGNDN